MKVSLIIPAGGLGQRLQSKQPKQFLLIQNKPILQHTLEAFSGTGMSECVIPVPEGYENQTHQIIERSQLDFKVQVIIGGLTRAASIQNAFNKLKKCDYVLIHDAARPFVSKTVIQRVLNGIDHYECVIPVLPVVDTVKRLKDGIVDHTLERNCLVCVQTPQAVKYQRYQQALETMKDSLESFTDDASLMEAIQVKVKAVDGEKINRKITTPDDLVT